MPRAPRRVFAALAGTLCASVFMAAPSAVPAAQAGSRSGPPLVTQVAVIPPDPAPAVIEDKVVMAGATGFLHQYKFSDQYLWTDYATGHTVTVPALPVPNLAPFTPAGGDSVAVVNKQANGGAGEVSEFDLADMTWTHWTVPAGHWVLGVFGNSVFAPAISGGKLTSWQVHTFAKDGTDTVTTVTGVPAGAALVATQPDIGDATAQVVAYGVSGVVYDGLLDLTTAVFAPIPDPDHKVQSITLSADSVGFYDPSTEAVRVYSRAGLLDGSDTSPRTVTLPGASGAYHVALAGDHVIAAPAASGCLNCAYPLAPALDVPLSGAAPGQALPQAQTTEGGITQAAGGAALIIGGTGASDWSVRKLTVDGGDSLTDTAVLPLTGPLSNAGLSISQGLVRHIEAEPVPAGQPYFQLFNHQLVPDTSPYLTDPTLVGGPLAGALPCATGGSCVRTIDGNVYGTSYLSAGTTHSIVLQQDMDGWTSTERMYLPSAGGTLTDAALYYAIVDGVRPARQYVANVGQRQILSSGPVTGAALWFDTLWRSAGAGRLRSTDLDARTTAAIATGVKCTASEIQATQRWIYWSCGQKGPAGVYDLREKTDIRVPAGPMLLGDGYLVHHDGATGNLILYDVHAGKLAAPVTLATVPAGPAADDRGITWAVDKYSGDVAYVAADDSVHVISTGVPATPPAITYPPGPWLPGLVSPAPGGGWGQDMTLSRPVTSWTLTIRRAGTAQVVRTQSGGAARTGLFASWNGRLPGGAEPYSGVYTWSLSATTAGSSARLAVPGSTLIVRCGRIPFRSYDCNGEPSLLADNAALGGESDWFNGTGAGRLYDNGYTDNWPLCPGSPCVSAIVPFGDFNGDGYADVLVRYGNGVLRAYLGFGQTWFNTQGTKSISLGTGWNAYNALAYPGDLTGDGKPDLVARDAHGRLWLFASTGKGKFRARTEISGGWGGYARLIGAGDLTGYAFSGGAGDLLAIDKSGVMWLFKGTGHGGFLPRHRVSSGWSRYNAVIGIGDLSIDGCNDLVARDRHGTLWRFDGNCRGGFAGPVKIGTGWGKYQALF